MEGYFNWDVTVQQGCVAEMVGGERPERCFWKIGGPALSMSS